MLGEDGIARTPPAPVAPPAPTGDMPRYALGPAIAPIYHPSRERTGATGTVLALSTLPDVPLVGRPDLPAVIAIDALPARPVQLQSAAVLIRASDGSYHRVLRHVVAPVAPAALPPIDFDQT